MFAIGIQKEINKAFFDQLPMRDQNEFLQQIYDNGYNVPEIAKHLRMSSQTIYSRIEAYRGRGVKPAPTV
ncbi:helix-turn-helix domain-containing protein [Shewanella colwelliana]|uniref:helix-turn-helix domain-containing protein n=1 Tax=Shewanella colwelliana TaxID=23 RepID=UPI003CFDE48D